mmetsp:Transcript_134555/g.318961  ORF Transcript_134555/g.318961 Transcript_134555/m.318961 type:complete len:81 (-) Transcript_134555:268-510(-)
MLHSERSELPKRRQADGRLLGFSEVETKLAHGSSCDSSFVHPSQDPSREYEASQNTKTSAKVYLQFRLASWSVCRGRCGL